MITLVIDLSKAILSFFTLCEFYVVLTYEFIYLYRPILFTCHRFLLMGRLSVVYVVFHAIDLSLHLSPLLKQYSICFISERQQYYSINIVYLIG